MLEKDWGKILREVERFGKAEIRNAEFLANTEAYKVTL